MKKSKSKQHERWSHLNKFLEEQKDEENFELSCRAQISKRTDFKLRSDTIVLRKP